MEIYEIIARLDKQSVEIKNKYCNYHQWAKDYTEFHKNGLNDNFSKKIVAIPNTSGLSDRIVGFATVFLIGLLTNRIFQLGRRVNLPLIEISFTSPYLNWTRLQDPEWLIAPLKSDTKIRNYNTSILNEHQYFAYNTMDDISSQIRLMNENLNEVLPNTTNTIFMTIARGRTIKLFENKFHQHQMNALGLNQYNIFGCIINYLIAPRPEIFLPIHNEFRIMTNTNPNILKIGIQIRLGDGHWVEPNKQHKINDFKVYFDCASQIESFVLADSRSKYTKVIWYLLTESFILRNATKHYYGMEKVVTSTAGNIEHTSKEFNATMHSHHKSLVSDSGFQLAAAEWWLFGFADYFVITKPSGFGRAAAMRSLKSNRIYSVPHFRPGKQSLTMNCDRHSFTPIENLGTDWAGI